MCKFFKRTCWLIASVNVCCGEPEFARLLREDCGSGIDTVVLGAAFSSFLRLFGRGDFDGRLRFSPQPGVDGVVSTEGVERADECPEPVCSAVDGCGMAGAATVPEK